MSELPIRWGILGTGHISKQFVRGLAALPNTQVVAVGSRTQASADAFGAEFDVPHRHASYEALASDGDIDAVYIGTPHPLHAANMLLCLDAGKAVLCEKPFTVSGREAKQVISLAREKRLFLMEAMWTRFLPAMAQVRALLAQGAIGEARMLYADFGFRTDFNPQHRLFSPAMAGGALLDVGIYPVSLAAMIFGIPERIVSAASLGQTGVDEQNAAIFSYSGGRIAVVSSATRTSTPQEATIMGTNGRIRLHAPWWRGTRMTLARDGQPDEIIEAPIEGNGYNYEAAEVARCIRAGYTESDVMPLDETLAQMRTLDELRRQWGLAYPNEPGV
jgi:predicted dehydrogenase